MRKITVILLLVAVGFVTFAQINKVAVVAIYGNKMIDGSDFGNVTALRTLANDDAFNLTPIVEKFKDKLFNDFAKYFPFTLLDENLVIGNQEYKNLGELDKKTLVNVFCTMPVGYYYFNQTKDPISKLFAAFEKDSIDAIMFVTLDYKLYKTTEIAGFGTAKVYANVSMYIYDKEGKKIFALYVFKPSKKSLSFALGGTVIQASEILPLCEQATDDAFVQMQAKLPKALAKMNKKVNK